MFWDRQPRSERAATLREIQEVLRRHHRNAPGPEAHPKDIFPVPEWDGANTFEAGAISGTAPTWDL